MSKILVASIHPEEWNQYTPFNGYLSTIRHNYDYVIAVVAEKPLILIDADEYYTVKDKNNGYSYPKILETSFRENHYFIDLCIDKIKEDFKDDDLTFVSWQNTSLSPGIVNILDDATNIYITSFACAQIFYQTKKLIYPTFSSFLNIQKKYKHLFNSKTFIILSRNFVNKATCHNTINSVKNFKSLVSYLCENGINIVNVGFPPEPCCISQNYSEINDPLSQDELLSLSYLSNGILSQMDAGGIVSHLSCNADFFSLSDQWTINNDPIFDLISNRTKKVDTIPLQHLLDFDKFPDILKILYNYTPKRFLSFAKEKKITYVL